MKEGIESDENYVYGIGELTEEAWVFALSVHPKLWNHPPRLPAHVYTQEFLKKLVPTNLALAVHLEDQDDATALAAVKFNPLLIGELQERHKENKAIMLSAVSSDGRLLRFGGDVLRDDKEVVLAAVKSEGYALRYARGLRGDKEVCLAAVRNDEFFAPVSTRTWWHNTNEVLSMCRPDLQEDKQVVCAFVAQHCNWLGDHEITKLDVRCGLSGYVKETDDDYDNFVLFNLGQKAVQKRWLEARDATGDLRRPCGNIYGQGAAAARFNGRIMEFLLPCQEMFEEAMRVRCQLSRIKADALEKAALAARAEDKRVSQKEMARIRGKYARYE